MTLDDDRRLAAIERDLRAFADVRIEPAMAIVSAVGDNLRRDPALAVRLIAALDGLPAADGVAGGLAPEPDGRARRSRCARRHDAAARRSSSVGARSADDRGDARLRVLLVGHGRMGRLVEQLAAECGVEIVGISRETSATRCVGSAGGRRDRFLDGGRGRRQRAAAGRARHVAGDRHDRLAGVGSAGPRVRSARFQWA